MNTVQQGQLLIVGAGMATAYLLEEMARHSHGWNIKVIGEEDRPCYNRVLLSSLLAGEVGTTDLDMLPPDYAAEFLSATRASDIDLEARRVTCADGSTHDYTALVLATGAGVAVPDFADDKGKGLRVVRTVADVEAIRALPAAGTAKRAVVVGGGLLGLEAAHGLAELGFATTVVHRNTALMNQQLDAEGGHYLQRTLERRGLAFRTGIAPAALKRDEAGFIEGLELNDGSTLECEQLVLATGITPRTDLARGAGLTCDRGVVVDEHLCTSKEGVYALGECSQYQEQTFGLVAPVRDQAAVLARSLCGVEGPAFAPGDWPVQLKISGVDIFRAGGSDAGEEQLVLRDPAHGVYRRLGIRGNRLVSAMLVGDRGGSTWYAELINTQHDIAALRQGLMFGRDVAEALQGAATA